MNRLWVSTLLVAGVASVASAGIINGTFDSGLDGWTVSGSARVVNDDFGLPFSPSGAPAAGVIISWGGSWDGPSGSISQIVTGVTGEQILSGELFAAARYSDSERPASVDVLWNGTVVQSLLVPSEDKWAADFPWVSFSVPVTATGNDELKVNFGVRFAEWTWTAVDNLAITPEPASLMLVALGLPLLRRRR